MGYETGAAKYFVKAFGYPIPYYIFGGTLLWVLDVLQLIGSRDANEFALNYILIHYAIPSSLGDAVLQLAVGAAAATALWYAAVKPGLRRGA